MKLLRYGERGAERPGILDPQGVIRDLSGVVKDIAGEALGPEGLKRIKDLDLGSLPAVKGRPRLGPPIAMVPKFLGIGLNYRDHAEETGMPIPEAPIIFAKATSCISGPNDPILMPKGWERMDFEVELAFAIGSVAKNVSEADALSYVAGYMIADDVSERSLQKGGPGEWIKAKSYDSFGPLGPWLVTKDEVPDPQALGLDLAVFVEVQSPDHSKEWMDKFAEVLATMPEVMEVYRMAGDIDYLLRIAVSNMADYDLFYRKLIAAVPLKNVTSRFAMERVKYTTAYPVPGV